jgi:hypothetical protein
MKRTQIYLDQDDKRELEKLARRNRTSMGELVREAVSRYLKTETKRKILLKDDPVYQLIGAGRPPEKVKGRKKTNYGEKHDEIYTEDWNR